jgi:hypothetical protein
MKEPNYFLVHMIDKDGRRWYSPSLVEEYSGLEQTKNRCRRALAQSKHFVKAEISLLEPKVIATVEK